MTSGFAPITGPIKLKNVCPITAMHIGAKAALTGDFQVEGQHQLGVHSKGSGMFWLGAHEFALVHVPEPQIDRLSGAMCLMHRAVSPCKSENSTVNVTESATMSSSAVKSLHIHEH